MPTIRTALEGSHVVYLPVKSYAATILRSIRQMCPPQVSVRRSLLAAEGSEVREMLENENPVSALQIGHQYIRTEGHGKRGLVMDMR